MSLITGGGAGSLPFSLPAARYVPGVGGQSGYYVTDQPAVWQGPGAEPEGARFLWHSYMQQGVQNMPGVAAASTINTQSTLTTITKNLAADGSPLPIVYGRAQLGGRPFAINYDSGTWTVGYAVCMGEINAITDVYLNELAAVAGVTVNTYTGVWTQGIDPLLAAAIPGYGDNLVFAIPDGYIGVAYVVIEYTDGNYDGWPTLLVEVEGRKVWNPVQQVSIFSENPALHLADYIASTVYGMGLSVNEASLLDAQAYCNDSTLGETRRTSYAVLDTPQTVETWAEVLRTYASAFIVRRGDVVHIIPDMPGNSVRDITADDIQKDTITIRKKDSSELPTVIRAIYTDTTGDIWRERLCEPAMAAGVAAGTTPWRESRIRLTGVGRHSQAHRECVERLNKLQLSDLEVSFGMFDEGVALELGDIVRVSHPYGLTLKPVRISSDPVQVAPGRWAITADEYDPAAYSDQVVSQPTYVDGTLPSGGVRPGPPTALVTAEALYQLANGEYASRIEIGWTPPVDSFVTGYSVQVLDGADVVYSANTTETGAATGPLKELVTYTVNVFAYNSLYNSPLLTGTQYVDGIVGEPEPPTNVSGSNNDSTVHLYWTASTSPDARRYEVRYYATTETWADGTLLEVVAGLNLTSRGIVPDGQWRFGVKTINSVGTYSTLPDEVDIIVAQAPDGTAAITTYYTDVDPSLSGPIVVGSIWYHSGDSNTPFRWDGSNWVEVSDGKIGLAQADASAALAAAGDAQASADGKVTTFYSETAPIAEAVGDLWISSLQGINRLYRASAPGSSNWVEVQDADIADAIQQAGDAQATADGKIVTFYGDTAPEATAVGDLWVNTTDGLNVLFRASAPGYAAWIQISEGVGIKTYYTDVDPTITEAVVVEGSIWYWEGNENNPPLRFDGTNWIEISDSVKTYYSSVDPSIGNTIVVGSLWYPDNDVANPAYRWDGTNWIQVGAAMQTYYTDTEPTIGNPDVVIGSIWYVSSGSIHTPFRWDGTVWREVSDGSIAVAQETADEKAKTFTGTDTPVGMAEGDQWVMPVQITQPPGPSAGASVWVQSRTDGETLNNGNSVSIGSGGSVEGDLPTTTGTPIGVAGVISSPSVKVTTAGSANVVLTLHVNDVASSAIITITPGSSGDIVGTGTATVAVGDLVDWRVTTTATGVIVTMLALVFTPTVPTQCATVMNVNNTGSTNINDANTDFFFKVGGTRTDRAVEDDVAFEWPIPVTATHYYTSTGTVQKVNTMTSRLRINGANGNGTVSYAGTGAGQSIFVDETNSDTLADGDIVNYVISNGSDSDTLSNNIEKIGFTGISSAYKFLNLYADEYVFDQTDNLTRYYPLGGQAISGGSVTESDVEYTLPIAINASELLCRVVLDVMTSDSYVVLRKNNADVGTIMTVRAAGHYNQTIDVDFAAGDTICYKVVTGATGTRVRWGHFGLVTQQLGGTSPPGETTGYETSTYIDGEWVVTATTTT